MIKTVIVFIMLFTTGSLKGQLMPQKKARFSWDSLPSIPDSIGFAGSFAGLAGEVLIVAGGSNFPDGRAPWNGGIKKWYDKIFVLEKPTGRWKEAGRLPFALGYGVSISTPDGLILIGGSNETGHYADVLKIRYSNGKIEIEKLPSLPFPLANTCGALVGDNIFVAGGLPEPNAQNTTKAFLCFDLEKKRAGWKLLPPWPGTSRMLSVSASDGKHFFLFSGTELINGSRVYLNDAYVYSINSGWKKLPDLPHATVAAPSPAYFNKALYIFGGDTGKDAKPEMRDKHPGFSKSILKYNISKNTWSQAGEMPDHPPVTTSLVVWKQKIILPGGEIRPAVRTPQVPVAEWHEQ
jgi:N-acetylneuraminate epimerase